MPLENADYISELDPNNPLDGETAEKGDDHLRVIKRALQQSFPDVAGPVNLSDTKLNSLLQNIRDDVEATINFILPHTEQKGSIKPWSTVYAPIPAGWQLCDGSNDTPDLRGRFIVGSGANGYSMGNTGGSNSKNTGNAGSHNHGGNTANHQLSVGEMPSHDHDFRLTRRYVGDDTTGGVTDAQLGTANRNYQNLNVNVSGADVRNRGGNKGHRHKIGSDGGHNHSFDTRPPYYALAWIIKTSEVTAQDITDFIEGLST